jgi:hypothetical protein
MLPITARIADRTGEKRGQMAHFADAPDVYRHVGRLIENLLADPAAAEQFATVDAVVQYRYRAPEATITIDLRAGHDIAVRFGPVDLEPQIVLSMDADVAHLLWLGELDVTIALARDQLSATGPIERLLAAVTAIEPAGPRYRAQLAAEGRDDLLAADDVDPRTPRAAEVAR